MTDRDQTYRAHARRRVPTTFRTIRGQRLALVSLVLLGGFAAIVAGGVAAGVAEVSGGRMFDEPDAAAFLYGTVGALVAGALVFALYPLLRHVFHMSRDTQLVEAASPLHPLLKRIMAEAPGTYMHSLAVANMAEAGAQAVGADPLLARVGSYYHDLGKLSRPAFFFENQDGRNPHDMAQPAVSASIITAHVRDGLELGEQYHLPDAVLQIIAEHHGTTLVRYFFHRAAEQDAGVFESDFRYPFNIPSSKEAALVMLADGSEASVRALEEPTREAVEDVVRSVIAERAADGQLLDAGFSDDDIERIVEAFGKVLRSQYHLRCEYPQCACAPSNGEFCADQRVESAGS